MANWITHQWIAKRILDVFPQLCAKEFCIGSIAPDCNIENETWTAFTPPREVTHFMQTRRKSLSDCQYFLDHFLASHPISSKEEASFWLGYLAHLITDAAYQHIICDDPTRTHAMWERISSHPLLRDQSANMTPSWANGKQLIPFVDRKNDIDLFEAELLESDPTSPYLTVLPYVTDFPDYAPFLPPHAITRKLKVMYNIPEPLQSTPYAFVLISRDEYRDYIQQSLSHSIYRIQTCIQSFCL